MSSVNVRSISPTEGLVDIRLDQVNGPLLARVKLEQAPGWKVFHSRLVSVSAGVHDLMVINNGTTETELDWISFE